MHPYLRCNRRRLFRSVRPRIVQDKLRADPELEDVARPVDLVTAGTVALALPGATPHWQRVHLPDGRHGWVYRPNLA
jgi:hypothetical protein